MKNKLINFFVSKETTDWILVQRKHDILLSVPQDKLKIGSLENLKKKRFSMYGDPNNDPVVFYKFRRKENG